MVIIESHKPIITPIDGTFSKLILYYYYYTHHAYCVMPIWAHNTKDYISHKILHIQHNYFD